MSALITLTTDFGLRGNYSGALKGAILSVCPQAQIVEITHEIGPQDIEEGVYVTSCAWPYYLPGAVHLAVVDPGVGTDRKAIAIRSPQGVFIGPDNGLLSACLPPQSRPAAEGAITLPPTFEAFHLVEPKYFRAEVSHTFHGRDLFGPVAGHVASGVPLEALGPALAEVHALPRTTATQDGGAINGSILHIDTYGNLVTNIPGEWLPAGPISVDIAGARAPGLGRTYGEASALFALVTSDGWLAVALPNSSAAAKLAASRRDPVRVTRA
ncbi:MAG: SAM-dependent chlorinase/fluorinase [Dehalococcoidia bacterium]